MRNKREKENRLLFLLSIFEFEFLYKGKEILGKKIVIFEFLLIFNLVDEISKIKSINNF